MSKLEETLVIEPNSSEQEDIRKSYFTGYAHGSLVSGYIDSLLGTGVEFTPEQITQMVIAKITYDMNIELGWMGMNNTSENKNEESLVDF